MAAPFVAGAAALLAEYLSDVRGVAKPSAALLKTMLIASARKVGSPIDPDRELIEPKNIGFPDFAQGFGLIDLSSLLPYDEAPPRRIAFADFANDSAEALASRQPEEGPRKSFHIYEIGIAAGAKERLRVVLCWTDWPASYVQNNLQLTVHLPDGRVLLGNQEHFSHKDPVFADSAEGTPFDKKNNVEVIEISNPSAGSYRVRVDGGDTAFPMDEPMQGYALVVIGELESDQLKPI